LVGGIPGTKYVSEILEEKIAQCQVVIQAGSYSIELNYRLMGTTMLAVVRCIDCKGWLGIGFLPQQGQLRGGGAVIGWLDGLASPKFLGKYEMKGDTFSAEKVELMDFAQQTLSEASIKKIDGDRASAGYVSRVVNDSEIRATSGRDQFRVRDHGKITVKSQ